MTFLDAQSRNLRPLRNVCAEVLLVFTGLGILVLLAAAFIGLSCLNGSVNMSVADYGRSMILYLVIGGLGSFLVMEASLFLEKHAGVFAKACGFLGRHTMPVLCLHLFVYSIIETILNIL